MQSIKRKSGTETVPVAELRVPDLWHTAMYLRDNGKDRASEAVLECWYLAHDLLDAVREEPERDAGEAMLTAGTDEYNAATGADE